MIQVLLVSLIIILSFFIYNNVMNTGFDKVGII